MELNAKDLIDECGTLPIVFKIEGDGCLNLSNECGEAQTLCGPGIVPWEGNNGIVIIEPVPGDGMQMAAAIGLPKGNLSIRKERIKFFYDGRYFNFKTESGDILVITIKFRKIIVINPAPAGNVFGKVG